MAKARKRRSPGTRLASIQKPNKATSPKAIRIQKTNDTSRERMVTILAKTRPLFTTLEFLHHHFA
jgi:hypothetical protein